MNSTDFRELVGANITAADKTKRHMAHGGHAAGRKPPTHGHGLTIVIPLIPPAVPPGPAAAPQTFEPDPRMGALERALLEAIAARMQTPEGVQEVAGRLKQHFAMERASPLHRGAPR